MKLPSLKIAVPAVLIILAVGYSFLPRAIPVELAEVAEGTLTVTIDEDGKTRVRDRFEIRAPITGKLLRISLRPGHEVRAGETMLATILPTDSSLLDPRTRAESEARVKSARAELQRAGEDASRAEKALALAQSELTRKRGLAASDHISDEELTRAEFEAQIREAERRAAVQAQAVAKFNLEQAEAALFQQAEGSFAERSLVLVSPIDGAVFRVFEESEGFVTAGTPLLEIADPTNLEVVVDLLSKDAVQVQPGADVWLEHWGGEQRLQGRVRLVEPSGFTKISALGVEEQRVNAVIDLVPGQEGAEALGDGYRVEARIVVWQGQNLVLAPDAALFRQGDGWAVFKVVDGAAHLTGVAVGMRGGLDAQILEGLAVGDLVINHPSDQIAEGTKVSAL